MRITYDPAKRARTLEERGLDFRDAAKVFSGFHLSKADLRRDYGEERRIGIGSLDGVAVVLVWTDRKDGRRIISMRKADKDEREEYLRQVDRSG